MDQQTSTIFSVLKLFIIPVGGGIPAGVLLAQAKGLAWPLTTLLYLVSDIALALVFEPVLRLISAVAGKISFLTRFSTALKAVTACSVAHIGGTSAGPLALVIISFGVVVAAWGDHGGLYSRAADVIRMTHKISFLRINKSGHPAHPLYLPKDLMPRVLERIPSAQNKRN